jgi:hypothetical protein
MVHVVIRLLAMATLVGFATAGLQRAAPVAADPVAAPGCGVTADPNPNGAPYGYVAVVHGDVPCPIALAVIDRYFHDPTINHNGNSWSAALDDGWSCLLPNAMAREYGWRTQCIRGGLPNPTAEVQIRFMPDDVGPPPHS